MTVVICPGARIDATLLGPLDSIADEHANSSTEMDVLPVYTRKAGSCTQCGLRALSTGFVMGMLRGPRIRDSEFVTLLRKFPPPLTVLVLCLAISLVGANRVEAAGSWRWPVIGPVVREFDKPETLYSEGHRGIDIGAITGREVRAPADGVVWFAGTVAGKAVLSIDTADSSIVSMEPVEASVLRGDVVHAGDVIGVVSGQHDGINALHLGIRVGGVYVNPRNYLSSPPRIVVYDSWVDSYALG